MVSTGEDARVGYVRWCDGCCINRQLRKTNVMARDGGKIILGVPARLWWAGEVLEGTQTMHFYYRTKRRIETQRYSNASMCTTIATAAQLKRTAGLVKWNTRVPCVPCAYYKHNNIYTRRPRRILTSRMHPSVRTRIVHRGLYIEPCASWKRQRRRSNFTRVGYEERGTRLYIGCRQYNSNGPAENPVRVPIDGLV